MVIIFKKLMSTITIVRFVSLNILQSYSLNTLAGSVFLLTTFLYSSVSLQYTSASTPLFSALNMKKLVSRKSEITRILLTINTSQSSSA